MATCTGTKADGKACALEAQPDSEHCRFHGPEEEGNTQEPEAQKFDGGASETTSEGGSETTSEAPAETAAKKKRGRDKKRVTKSASRPELPREGKVDKKKGLWLCTETTRSGKPCGTRYALTKPFAIRNHLLRGHGIK